MKKHLLFCIFFWGSLFQGLSQGDPEFIEIEDNLSLPVAVRNANDGSNRLFIVEKIGRILIYDLNTKSILATPFLDISDRVESSNGEEGLLGLAFDPNFASNGHFYVNYIRPIGATTLPDSTRVSRFTISSNANIALPNSEYSIITYEQPYNNHNGGDIHFGPDQFLYISSGDGGASNDPQNRSQDLTSYHGKILRLDITGDQYPADPLRNYIIPTSNPFVGTPSALGEIWHYGLRNPWRFSFDRLNGDMYIGDVGQNSWEEVSYAPSGNLGLNFGWNCKEGNSIFSSTPYCTNGIANNLFVDPPLSYDHTIGQSITGGYVYRGNTFTNFVGWHFSIDFVSNRLYMIKKNLTGTWSVSDQGANNNIAGVSSFGESESGELYALSYSNGKLYKLIDRMVCPNILNLSSSPLTDYGAVSEVNSTAIVPGNSKLNYYARDCIALLPGFSVPASTTFLTILEICGQP